MKNIKTFIVTDNSCQQCLDDNGENHYLGGTVFDVKTQEESTVDVLIQPFYMFIHMDATNKKELLPFIIGQSKDGLRHLILYTPLLNY